MKGRPRSSTPNPSTRSSTPNPSSRSSSRPILTPKTQAPAPFELKDLADHATLNPFDSYVDSLGNDRSKQNRRIDVIKCELAQWIIDTIKKNYRDANAVLSCLSVANQIIKEMHGPSPSTLLEDVLEKRKTWDFSEENYKNFEHMTTLLEIRDILRKLPGVLDLRLSKEKAQLKTPSLPVVTSRFISTKDHLSQLIVNLYQRVASTQDLTKQAEEVKEIETPARSVTPSVPQTPTMKKPEGIKTLAEYKELDTFWKARQYKKSSTATGLTQKGIVKTELFNYLISYWALHFIIRDDTPKDRRSLLRMLKIAFESSETIHQEQKAAKDQQVAADTFIALNEAVDRVGDKKLGLPVTEKASVGDIHLLMQYYGALLFGKYNNRLKDSNIDMPLLTKTKSKLSKLLCKLHEATESSPLIANVSANSDNRVLPPTYSSTAAVTPLSPQESIANLTALNAFKDLDLMLSRLSRKLQNERAGLTQVDFLNYLTLYWVIRFIENKDYPKDQNSLLKMLSVAYQAIEDISQTEKRTELLKQLGLPNQSHDKALCFVEMQIIMDDVPNNYLNSLTNKLPTAKIAQTLHHHSAMNNLSEEQKKLIAGIANLHEAVTNRVEFKAEQVQPAASPASSVTIPAQPSPLIIPRKRGAPPPPPPLPVKSPVSPAPLSPMASASPTLFNQASPTPKKLSPAAPKPKAATPKPNTATPPPLPPFNAERSGGKKGPAV